MLSSGVCGVPCQGKEIIMNGKLVYGDLGLAVDILPYSVNHTIITSYPMELRNQAQQSLPSKWKLSMVSAVCLPYMPQSLLTALTVNGNTSLRYAYRTCRSHYSQHSLTCCLRRLRLMATQVCGMPTVHAAVTIPSTVWDAAYGAYG